jgi:hypothetical protein
VNAQNTSHDDQERELSGGGTNLMRATVGARVRPPSPSNTRWTPIHFGFVKGFFIYTVIRNSAGTEARAVLIIGLFSGAATGVTKLPLYFVRR